MDHAKKVELGLLALALDIDRHEGDAGITLRDFEAEEIGGILRFCVSDYSDERTALGLLLVVVERFDLPFLQMPTYFQYSGWRWEGRKMNWVPGPVVFSDDFPSLAEACFAVIEAGPDGEKEHGTQD